MAKKKVVELPEEIEFSDEVASILWDDGHHGNWSVVAKEVRGVDLGNYPRVDVTMVLKDKKSNRFVRSEFEFDLSGGTTYVQDQCHEEVKKFGNKKFGLKPYQHFRFV